MQATDSPNTTARIPYPRKPCVMTDDVQAPHRPPLAADEAARADEAAAEPASAPAEAPVEAPIEAPVETSAAAPVRAPAAAAGAGELRALFSR
ncbi:Crp/Fnr family transcriptional regulator, partial [Burkholderia pseudomallei]